MIKKHQKISRVNINKNNKEQMMPKINSTLTKDRTYQNKSRNKK